MAASKSKTAKPTCSNCKRSSHSIDFCILSGGDMAGHSIDKARAAQCGALGKPPRGGKGENESSKSSNTTSTTHVAPTPFPYPSTPPFTSIMINGVSYHLALATPSATTATTSLAHYGDDDIPLSGDFVEYHGDPPLELEVSPAVSADWGDYSCFVDLFQYVASPVTHPAERTPVAEPQKYPFIFDIGATCHISPERSDFKSLTPCATHPVKGLFGSCVFAVGIGTIDLHLDAGRTLSFHDVLFVPASTIRLISISSLHRGGKYTTHFDSDGCWVSDKSNQIVAREAVSPTWQLYPVIATDPCALMAFKWSIKLPSEILPKTFGGELGGCWNAFTWTFVIQCRMSITSLSCCVYSMNVIDDFSSYFWRIQPNFVRHEITGDRGGDDPTQAKAIPPFEREYSIAGAREEFERISDIKVFVSCPPFGLAAGTAPVEGQKISLQA